MTPFKALYGVDPPTVIKYQEKLSPVDAVHQHILTRNSVLAKLKKNLELSQQEMKAYADKRRRDVKYNEGDMVYLYLQPYHHHSVARRPNEKLSALFMALLK